MESTKSEQGEQNSQTHLPPERAPKQSFVQGLGDFTRFASVVIVLVIVIRFFIVQPFLVSGTSMAPNFASNDYLIIDEISYRFHPVQHGDVIIFHPPVDMSTYYIKRVIGVPGDTVTVKNGVVTVTNAAHPNGVVLNEPYITPDTLVEDKTVTVPAGDYFVMGDNRPESYDSRSWGLLPQANITGRALIRLFPLKKFNIFPAEHKLESADGTTL